MRLHIRTRRNTALFCTALMTTSLLHTLPCTALGAEGVCINEVCTKNSTLAAPDGGYYDYIELYNPTDAPILLTGYGLSDDATLPYAFTFPEGVSIAPNDYLIVWCGVKSTEMDFLAAEFGLSKNGETIYLSTPSGVLEERGLPPMQSDTAYVRVPDGSDTFAIATQLTPGASNPSTSTTQIIVPKPTFSQGSGFYDDNFWLTLTASEGCTIYYTTDGSDPTTSSQQYHAPIQISNQRNAANRYSNMADTAIDYTPPTYAVDKATIIRAIAVDAEGNISQIATNSYFIGYGNDEYVKQMRVISLVTDPDNLFDYETGIYVYGKAHDDWRNSPEYTPNAQNWEQPGNCTQSGRAWERPASMTVFENGVATYSADLGIRIHGGATRSSPQKSFNLYARSEYGVTKLAYDFFHGELKSETDGKVIDSFDSLTLRNGGNDKVTKLRDRLNQELAAGRDVATLAQEECIVFLDGEFWGLYNLMEKMSDTYISDHYRVKADDVCIIKTGELNEGSEHGYADFQMMLKWLESADFTSPSTYQEFCARFDVKNFADYMAIEMLIGNLDFGGNNYALWKTETINEKKQYADGKWRFILFDTEYGQGLYGSNVRESAFESLKKQDCWLSTLFFGLMEHCADFRQLFATAYFDLCNENYSPTNATAKLDELMQPYAKPMGDTIKRFSLVWNWGGVNYENSFRNEANVIQQFYRERAQYAKNNFVTMFNSLISNNHSTINLSNDPTKGTVHLNTLTLTQENWYGDYFQQFPVTVSVDCAAGYRIAGWQVNGADASFNVDMMYQYVPHGDGIAQFLPTSNNISIEPIYEEITEPVFTGADVRALQQYLLTAGTLTTEQATAYDRDGNGLLTAADLTQLKQIVQSASS